MRYARCGKPKGTEYHLSPKARRWTAGERSDTETVTLRSERGDGKRTIARWYLAGRLLNLEDPFLKTQ